MALSPYVLGRVKFDRKQRTWRIQVQRGLGPWIREHARPDSWTLGCCYFSKQSAQADLQRLAELFVTLPAYEVA
jgi:hypothetical protein